MSYTYTNNTYVALCCSSLLDYAITFARNYIEEYLLSLVLLRRENIHMLLGTYTCIVSSKHMRNTFSALGA